MAKLTNVFGKDNKEEIKKRDTHPKRITKWIHYSKLKSNPHQYCDAAPEEIEALADMIEADGEVLQDLLIRKVDADEYEIIGGHKRWEACKLLVEQRNRPEFALLPCIVKDISDVRAQFQVYSSNTHHTKTPYEIMHELEEMEHLLTNYPEEFPDLQTGRMVERLAKQMNMKRATVGEYQSIAKNLTDEAMEEFKQGRLDKSAAVTISRMPEDAQKEVIEKGLTKDVDIKKFKEENLEPDAVLIRVSYHILDISDYDDTNIDRKGLAKYLKENFGQTFYRTVQGQVAIQCSKKHITISGKKVTWERYVQLVNKYCPKITAPEPEPKKSLSEPIQAEETEQKQELSEELEKAAGITLEEPELPGATSETPETNHEPSETTATIIEMPKEPETEKKPIPWQVSRKKYMEILTEKEMAQYLSKNLSGVTLKTPQELEKWLSEKVDGDGQAIAI